jgi:1,4-dihydroxy-2-naphthoate phytyltransferase
VDVAKTESVVRLTGSLSAVHNLAALCLLLGGGGLASLALSSPPGAAATILPLLAAALLCGLLYQAPPFRWSYKGRGEPLCFMSFGPLATCAFYLAAASAGGKTAVSLASVSPAAVVASLLVGCTTTAILFCSHFHQEATDKAAGKLSPIVRLGTARAAQALRLGVLATFALATAASLVGLLPLPVACAALLAAPVAKTLIRFVGTNHGDPAVVFKAKFFATRWHASTGLLLTLSFAAARLLAR